MAATHAGPRPAGSPGRFLPAALVLLLTLCLDPAAALAPELAEVEPAPRLSVTFNPKSRRLTWDCRENATDARCFMLHKEKGPIEIKPWGKACACTFNYAPLHGGVTFEVHATVRGRPVREELLYPNPGHEGTAARNFSCFIYDAGSLNCTWARGPAAPGDVQYFLFIENTKTQTEQECPLYSPDSGTHTGCHLRDLSALGFRNYFLLNGTSLAAPIQYFDSIWTAKEIERLSPPDNVTVYCNTSHCRIRWRPPQTWIPLTYKDFTYQLDIQRRHAGLGSGTPPVQVAGEAENEYCFPSPEPRARQAVRVRVADVRGGPWSAWSRPAAFGSDTRAGPALRLYVPVVLGTLVCALVLGFLFRRFVGLRALCPRVPQVKDKVSSVDGVAHQVPWEDFAPGIRKGELEDVLTVEEVS
ncbi:granulocyte-macrophage colony-stimulating factor receptor subunit alpha isoform X2 [Heterocephalus glaber]|uniref:Granulocyte-macrophage colony-stimulating factor receptor subunit alpha isoform X2 n=1 Tax=Heterocephalus glaber TaxID=10181 RepID=A0AAX6Q6Z0_HETGA|nr:granulocyte-macrophage colony-stimulating factor receptor subunit alpha isoform X2 [Heterocephalus glaber]